MSTWNDRNARIIEEFRANDGQVGGRYEDMTLLLLHTTGARSGRERVNPLVTTKVSGDQIIIASKGGAPDHPDWYHNLKANPEVEVELGSETYRARAEITEEPDRRRLFDEMAERYPFFDEYEKKTERVIPVIRLKRTG